jgi:hypothetical protein
VRHLEVLEAPDRQRRDQQAVQPEAATRIVLITRGISAAGLRASFVAALNPIVGMTGTTTSLRFRNGIVNGGS